MHVAALDHIHQHKHGIDDLHQRDIEFPWFIVAGSRCNPPFNCFYNIRMAVNR